MSSLQQNKNFKGSLGDFIKKIKECNHYYDIQDDKITERLVRYYITQSIIPRPKRDGKEFFYLYDHLLKFLYARKQIIDGWPLTKLKEMMKFEENQYFEDFFKSNFKTDNTADSMSLIKSFKSETRNLSAKKVSQISNPIKYQERKDIPNLKEALLEINADLGNVVKQEFTVLELASWLILQIERNKLSGMTYELSRKIGDAISAALIERNPMTTQELQAQFNKNQEYEQLNFEMEKLRRENDYLRVQLIEEKQDRNKNENLRSNVILKFGRTLEKMHDRMKRASEKNYYSNSALSNSIGSIILDLKNIDPKYLNGDVIERLGKFTSEIDNSITENENNFSSMEDDMHKLKMELDRISKIIEK